LGSLSCLGLGNLSKTIIYTLPFPHDEHNGLLLLVLTFSGKSAGSTKTLFYRKVYQQFLQLQSPTTSSLPTVLGCPGETPEQVLSATNFKT
jgi:hypothetical protein